MGFFRKLARRTAPLPMPEPCDQEGATDLATSDGIATHAPATRLPSTAEHQVTAQTAHGPSGHRYDRVQIGGESRTHLGDVYNRHVTYNYGAPFLPLESTEKRREDEDIRRREAARLEAEGRLEEEKRIASERQRLDFLQALRFDAMDSRQATIGLAHTNTCTWIVEAPEYVRWRDESCRSVHHGVLWIKGKPGSGKSTLMKYVLNDARERDDGDITASFFFNARGQPLEKSAEGMYRSLLRQVLSKLPHLYSDRTHAQQQNWSVEMLRNILQTTVMALNSGEHLVLYIDALDECIQDEVRDVVGHFEELVDLAVSRGLRLSICFSSRHYPHISMHKFEELKLDGRTEHIDDISKYVHSNVSRLDVPLSTKAQIEAEIERRSSGIFLWAVLVIKIIKEKRDDGAPLSELMSSLAAVPDKLGSLFASILARCDKGTITAFQWVLYARRSLSPSELYFAIKTSTNQLITGELDCDDADAETIGRFIARSTRGLVEVFEDKQQFWHPIVQYIHESVREHLLEGGLASLTAGDSHLIEGSAHADIARYCLSYIQLDSSKYLYYFNSYPRRLRAAILSKRFPLLRFVLGELHYHANLAYKAGSLSIEFLSELPLELIIRGQNIMLRTHIAIEEPATIIFWLLAHESYNLAEALLARCAKTEEPGIVTFGTAEQPVMTFDINMRCGGYPGSALGAAATCGRIELVQQLLRLGAEIVPSRRDVRNPLILATELDFEDIAELLLQNGADVNAVCSYARSDTALICAVYNDNHDIASLLLSYGADFQYRGKCGTALDYALLYRHTEIARLLWDAQFPKSEWDRTLIACINKTEEHRYDAVTVHDIKQHIGNLGDRGYETGSVSSSKHAIYSYDSDLYSSSESTTSVQTI